MINKSKLFSICTGFIFLILAYPASAGVVAFGFDQDGNAIEVKCDFSPEETDNHNCRTVFRYTKYMEWFDRVFVYISKNANNVEYWIDRTEPFDINGYIVRYMQLVKGGEAEGISIAIIDGNCHNKTFIIRQVSDYDFRGINQSMEYPEETVNAFPGTIGYNILKHICSLYDL
jgi:hypothetical protein